MMTAQATGTILYAQTVELVRSSILGTLGAELRTSELVILPYK